MCCVYTHVCHAVCMENRGQPAGVSCLPHLRILVTVGTIRMHTSCVIVAIFSYLREIVLGQWMPGVLGKHQPQKVVNGCIH